MRYTYYIGFLYFMFSNVWIHISQFLPQTLRYILLSFTNRTNRPPKKLKKTLPKTYYQRYRHLYLHMFNDIKHILLTLQAPVSPSPTHMWVFRMAVGCHCRAQLCWSITLITNSFSLVGSPVSENNWERQDWLINRKNCV